jgi:ribonuclease R
MGTRIQTHDITKILSSLKGKDADIDTLLQKFGVHAKSGEMRRPEPRSAHSEAAERRSESGRPQQAAERCSENGRPQALAEFFRALAGAFEAGEAGYAHGRIFLRTAGGREEKSPACPQSGAERERHREGVSPGRNRKKEDAGREAAAETFTDLSGDLDRIQQKYSLQTAFPKKALQNAHACLALPADEITKRPRIKDWIITIDSAEAKDLDDAISLKKLPDGWELSVHIADVSYYIAKGSSLDAEAYARGTSVYLNRHVIPMTPAVLSDDLCSLNADRPKLALTARITLTPDGRVRETKFMRTSIQVSRRFSYTEADGILQGKKDPDAQKLRAMRDLARLLRKHRQASGALDFELSELKIELDASGRVLRLTMPERGEAEMLIEDFMLLANTEAARFLAQNGLAFFRIHPEPSKEKLGEFVKLALHLGLRVQFPDTLTPLAMQKALKKIKGHAEEGALHSLLLRSLQKAVYSTEPTGHFGLACAEYTHFTSPIRRYPDLIVHRLLLAALAGKKPYSKKELQDIAEQSSLREQKAVEAEREYTRIKGTRFMEAHVGEIFEGKIASLTAWGMFITLTPYGLDGLLHVSALRDDYYRLDADGYALVGTKTKRTFRLGDRLSVQVKGADSEKGFIDLSLPNTKREAARGAQSERAREAHNVKQTTERSGHTRVRREAHNVRARGLKA